MDVKHILYSNINKPKYIKQKSDIYSHSKIKKRNEFILNSSVETKYGYDGNEFSFDNEQPLSNIKLNPFILTEFVTNEDWQLFIEDKGYSRPEFWLSDGWEFITKNRIDKPMYWIDKNLIFSLNGVEKINMDSPVSHISFMKQWHMLGIKMLLYLLSLK